MIEIYNQTMLEIVTDCEEALKRLEPLELLKITIPNPDLRGSNYSGNASDQGVIHHSWKAWFDLSSLLFCRMLTPHILEEGRVLLRFERLDTIDSFHQQKSSDKKEKYGSESIFATIDKNEETAFLYAYRHALQQVKVAERETILDLGINSGDEFDLIKKMLDREEYSELQLIGVDHSATAIATARERFPESNVTLHCHDINKLESLELPKANLIISIGTLQSPNIPFKTLFMSLVQNYLTKDGAVILGFPNSRWVDGEMLYGAKAPNYSFSEMSLLIKDIYFCKKYLQQHKFRVTITGKDYLFLTATRIGLI